MGDSPAAVKAVFRAKYGELCASLLSAFGYQRFDLVEEALQSAFERALERWPDGGVPNSPAGWLHAVARNIRLEALRHAVVSARVRGRGQSVVDAHADARRAAKAGEV